MEANFIKKKKKSSLLTKTCPCLYTPHRRLAQILQYSITIIVVELSVLRLVCKLKFSSSKAQDVLSTFT